MYAPLCRGCWCRPVERRGERPPSRAAERSSGDRVIECPLADDAPAPRGTKTIAAPVVGRLELAFEAMEPTADPGPSLFAHSAEPGSPSAEGLDLLASRAATSERGRDEAPAADEYACGSTAAGPDRRAALAAVLSAEDAPASPRSVHDRSDPGAAWDDGAHGRQGRTGTAVARHRRHPPCPGQDRPRVRPAAQRRGAGPRGAHVGRAPEQGVPPRLR
ncbi:MmyB family transcriptional regulator [Nocardiopsis akebiae]|uniref:MmyB family transcriptional regulator n=1 Tax=Nocardiopsis akebiae TaxID=2831968 RepID=UPI00308426CB